MDSWYDVAGLAVMLAFLLGVGWLFLKKMEDL